MTLLTQKECADVLRLSERTLERYRCSGTGPRFIKCGRSIRYRSQDIETWLRRTQSVPRQKGRLKAAVSPYVAFMDAYWEPDPIGEGTLVKLFEATFRHWCLQTEAFDLAGTSKSNMIQEIKKIPRWTGSKPTAQPATTAAAATVSNSKPGPKSLTKSCVAITTMKRVWTRCPLSPTMSAWFARSGHDFPLYLFILITLGN